MTTSLDLTWTSANQHLLAAEFLRLRALLGDGDPVPARQQVDARAGQMPAPAAIDTLATLFELSGFERDLLLLAAGVEMDARLATLCAKAAGHPERPWVTFGLALAALPDAHWSAIAPVEALRRWRLIEVDDSAGLTAGRITVEERVLHFIGGLNYLDHRLQPLFEPVPPAGFMDDAHLVTADRITAHVKSLADGPPIVQLTGSDPDGQQDVAATVAAYLGLSLFRLRAGHIPDSVHERASLLALWHREAALLGAGLIITEVAAQHAAAARVAEQIRGLVFLSGAKPLRLEARAYVGTIDKADAPGQRTLWRAALGSHTDRLGGVVDDLATRHRFGARRIAEIAREIDGHDAAAGATLRRLCRDDRAALGELAQPIDARADWDDLILPDTQRRTLEQIAVHARHRLTVHHDWGFADKGTRGLGIATLFSGESGTGKTLAAEVLANTLGLALYRIDLSAVISKYIGETEKNLRTVFDGAEDLGAILLFDEADALFGKRSEVRDSHDRYANIEVSYLLQRMEAYRGLAILTTNHKSALDSAFSRRLRFVVHFPFPDVAQREAIWRRVFPAGTPLEALDYGRLARLNGSGGHIRNVALSAAFLAAEAGTPVTMAHLHRAAYVEAAKRETTPSDAEIRGWV
jgi:hypothetical protein